jgi:hypothetical protein
VAYPIEVAAEAVPRLADPDLRSRCSHCHDHMVATFRREQRLVLAGGAPGRRPRW